MKMSFRWFGVNDPIKIEYIKQIPNMYSIVSALYNTRVGEVWNETELAQLKNIAIQNNLVFEVVESVPVHEDIKLGKDTRDKYIENFCENLRLLAKYGIKCVCYNFMPVFDWTRTQIDKLNYDKSTSLVYYGKQLENIDILKDDITLPGWDSSYSKQELANLFDEYSKISHEDLWQNLQYFLQCIIKVAEEVNINMAIHPDDPPFDIFGLPRIITCQKNIERFLNLYPSKNNGFTFCTGSLGCVKSNDIEKMLEKFLKAGKVHFMHIRNVKLIDEFNSFEETAHFSKCGSLNIYNIIKILCKYNYEGYVRPDHGRMIFGEKGKAGYGLYDRALGASYINGLYEALQNAQK